MKQGLAITISVLILLIVIGLLLAFDVGRQSADGVIGTFEDCVKAGYPVMESYPRQCKTADGKNFTEVITTPATSTPSVTATPTTNPSQGTTTASNLIKNISIAAGDSVKSPLNVKGEAKGPWYFEATFPIQLKDANGKLLVESYGTAKGDWMTEDFVPFEATLTFTKPTTTTGTLIFMNANPSGDDSRALEVVIPIIFSQ
jgi:hypothetical protein